MEEKKAQLWELCNAFVHEQQIRSADSVYDMDHIIINAYEFIAKVCEIVGYHEDEHE